MEFRLLGPLELWDGDQLVQPRSWRLRTLLALLLLDANRPLPRDDLIDQLWRGAPPPSARASLHSYVYRLRQLLDGARTSPGVVLRTRADRYLLEVPPETLDLHRFERLVGDGQAAVGDGRLELGVERFRAALSLWRGPALADIDLEVVQSRSRRLEGGRMVALEECLSAELALGRYATVVAELEQKSAHGVRALALDPGTMAHLKAHRARCEKVAAELELTLTADAYAFPRTLIDGRPVRPDAMTRRFTELAVRLGHDYRLYGLRHFMATQLGAVAAAGTVRDRMGHGSLAVTSGYMHPVNEADREAARYMGELLDGRTVRRSPKAEGWRSSRI